MSQTGITILIDEERIDSIFEQLERIPGVNSIVVIEDIGVYDPHLPPVPFDTNVFRPDAQLGSFQLIQNLETEDLITFGTTWRIRREVAIRKYNNRMYIAVVYGNDFSFIEMYMPDFLEAYRGSNTQALQKIILIFRNLQKQHDFYPETIFIPPEYKLGYESLARILNWRWRD